MSPELSIIIPAYNASKYIEACITSIFSGTYNNMEVLLIDDGSTDGTGELCDRLTERYPAIRLFHTIRTWIRYIICPVMRLLETDL